MEIDTPQKDAIEITASSKGSCKTCTAFYKKPNIPDDIRTGECRNRSITRYGWPPTNEDGWCREYGDNNDEPQQELEFG